MLKVKEVLRQGLQDAGIAASDARAWRLGTLVEKKGVYISLRQVTVTQGAMNCYLGLDSDGNEIYGMAVDVQFALVLLSPKADGGYGAEAFAEETLNALLAASELLDVREVTCGEAMYDSQRDCFRQEMVVSNQMMAYGVRTDVGIALERFCIRASVQ